MKKIVFITTSRAEFGQFSYFLKNLSNLKNINLKLLVSGSHLFNKFGNSLDEIVSSKLTIVKKIKIKNFKQVDFENIPLIFSKITKVFTLFLKKTKPDFIILPCDRFEILIFAIISYFMKIPIIHFYGGETSEGSIDNITRNQVSLMAKYHFVSHENHKKNLIKIGISEKNIFNIGALAYEKIRNTKILSLKQIENKLNIKLKKPILLVTFHPVTLRDTKVEFKELLIALNKLTNFQIIFTGPNNDPGHKFIEAEIKKLCKNYPNNFYHFPHLGSELYYSLVKNSFLVMGNSSSLLYEVPYFKKVSINIGSRQLGRLFGSSIIHLEAKNNLIEKKIKNIKIKNYKFTNPYYKKNSLRICLNFFKKIILI